MWRQCARNKELYQGVAVGQIFIVDKYSLVLLAFHQICGAGSWIIGPLQRMINSKTPFCTSRRRGCTAISLVIPALGRYPGSHSPFQIFSVVPDLVPSGCRAPRFFRSFWTRYPPGTTIQVFIFLISFVTPARFRSSGFYLLIFRRHSGEGRNPAAFVVLCCERSPSLILRYPLTIT